MGVENYDEVEDQDERVTGERTKLKRGRKKDWRADAVETRTEEGAESGRGWIEPHLWLMTRTMKKRSLEGLAEG